LADPARLSDIEPSASVQKGSSKAKCEFQKKKHLYFQLAFQTPSFCYAALIM